MKLSIFSDGSPTDAVSLRPQLADLPRRVGRARPARASDVEQLAPPRPHDGHPPHLHRPHLSRLPPPQGAVEHLL